MKENLKSFKCDQVIFTNNSPDTIWERILQNLSLCQKLEVLKLRDATCISNFTLKKISNLPNLKRLTLLRLGSYASELAPLFQKMNLEKLKFIQIEGSLVLSNEAVHCLSNRKPPNLEYIWFQNCPNLKLQESTLKNLKNCPKLKCVGFDGSNLDGISTDLLREINEHIRIRIYHMANWIKLNKKLKIDQCKEEISKVIEEYGFVGIPIPDAI